MFIKDCRETDSPPMPMQAVARIKGASTKQDEHIAPNLLGRVMARLRGGMRVREYFSVRRAA